MVGLLLAIGGLQLYGQQRNARERIKTETRFAKQTAIIESGFDNLNSRLLEILPIIVRITEEEKEASSSMASNETKERELRQKLDSLISSLKTENNQFSSLLSLISSENKELSSAVSRIQSNNKELSSAVSRIQSNNKELSSAVSRMESRLQRHQPKS